MKKHQASEAGGPSVTVSPSSVTSPVQPGVLTVSGSGFAEGNFVSVSVPWVGSPTEYSVLSFNATIGPDGGFSFSVPPEWTALELKPGDYPVASVVYDDDKSEGRNAGPSALLTVTQ